MKKTGKMLLGTVLAGAAATTIYHATYQPPEEPMRPELIHRCVKVVIPALLVLGIPAAITGCKDEVTVGSLPLIDTNDHLTESNELQDQTLKMALVKEYGTPIAFGATVGARGVRDDDWRNMLKLEGFSIPVVKGAPKQGLNQPMSPLATLIVTEAMKRAQLTVTIGGKWTDTALAVKYHPEVCPKLRVIGIGGTNIGGSGADEYNTVRRCVDNLTTIGRGGYANLITKHCSSRWLDKHVRPKKVGKHVYASHGRNWVDEARKLNIGQFRVDTYCRIADFKATGWGMAGRISDEKLMSIAEKGLAKMP